MRCHISPAGGVYQVTDAKGPSREAAHTGRLTREAGDVDGVLGVGVGPRARPDDRRSSTADAIAGSASESIPRSASRDETRDAFLEDYPAVYRHLVYLTSDRALAEDLAQETFGKLIEREDDPAAEPLVNRRAWLLTVASNLAYNQFRSEARRQEREGRIVDAPESELDDVLDVRQTLARLEPRDRTVLLLRYSGFSYAEIADAVGVKPSSVGTTLARAQQRFRDTYEAAQVTAAGPNSHDTDRTSKGSDPHAL